MLMCWSVNYRSSFYISYKTVHRRFTIIYSFMIDILFSFSRITITRSAEEYRRVTSYNYSRTPWQYNRFMWHRRSAITQIVQSQTYDYWSMDLVCRLVLKKETKKFSNCIYFHHQVKGSVIKGVDEIFETFLEWTRFEEIQKGNNRERPFTICH